MGEQNIIAGKKPCRELSTIFLEIKRLVRNAFDFDNIFTAAHYRDHFNFKYFYFGMHLLLYPKPNDLHAIGQL